MIRTKGCGSAAFFPSLEKSNGLKVNNPLSLDVNRLTKVIIIIVTSSEQVDLSLHRCDALERLFFESIIDCTIFTKPIAMSYVPPHKRLLNNEINLLFWHTYKLTLKHKKLREKFFVH